MATTTSDDRSDTDLLLAYGRDGDGQAFEALSARHVDMIFSVSLRRSGNRQLAEEATQNVLVSLSMKAQKLAVLGSGLSGWLHTATKFEVAKLQRRETRIKRREQAYASENMTTSTQDEDGTFLRLLPLLDQAIDHLRAADREVIVRRYLEEQDFNRIGEALGIIDDAAQKRTTRAFERLNQFFRLGGRDRLLHRAGRRHQPTLCRSSTRRLSPDCGKSHHHRICIHTHHHHHHEHQ